MSEEQNSFDVAVIGGGPGGYVAAIRASQLGLKTALIEKRETLGGTCLNIGCIPSKALLSATEHYHFAKEKFSTFGITASALEMNFETMMGHKEKTVSDVCGGVDFLMKKNKITRLLGTGRLLGEGSIELTHQGQSQNIQASKIILATGSVPVEIPFLPFDGEKIISSTEALSLKKVPETMLVIGAGAIGLELGSVYARLGTKVTIVEMLPSLLSGGDQQTGQYLMRLLSRQGIDFLMNHTVESMESSDTGVKLTVKNNKKDETLTLEGEILLVAAGRKAYVEGLGLESAGLNLNDKGKIEVHPETYLTQAENIYAIGDIIDGPMLAHKAEDEGVAVAEIIAGQKGEVNYAAIPSVVYVHPEAAWVGLGEEELKERGIKYRAGKFFLKGNGRARAMDETDGVIKVLVDDESDRILGVHMVAPHASEMIAEAALAMEFSATGEDIARTSHAHPSLSEAIKEAAMASSSRSIHS